MINVFVQEGTKSLRHHAVQVRSNKRQFVLGICRARTTVRSLWLLLSLCARENSERRNVTCGVKTGYEKENYSHISLLSFNFNLFIHSMDPYRKQVSWDVELVKNTSYTYN
jgi:hypothetical protein